MKYRTHISRLLWTGMIVSCLALSLSSASNDMVSLDAILKRLAVFEHGGGEEPLFQLRDYVLSHKQSPEARQACEETLVTFLRGTATADGKRAVCRSLRLIGSGYSVPILAGMLSDGERSDMARYALENIPGTEADAALISALNKTRGPLRAGTIASLGQRRSAGAVSPLKILFAGSDGETAAAAGTALGQIGDSKATEALIAALERMEEPLKSVAASALLRCAEDRMAENLPNRALVLYDRVLRARIPLNLKRAALRGKIASAGSESPRMLMDILSGRDDSLYETAISMVPVVFDTADLPFLRRRFPDLPAGSQRQILTLFAAFPAREVRSTVIAAAGSSDPGVRLEALRVLAKVGDGTTVPLLAERAFRGRGEEQASARASLRAMPGSDADAAILDLLGRASPGVRAELIQAIAERRIPAGKARLMELAASAEASDRLASIRGLRILAGMEDFVQLLNLLPALDDETEKEEMENTSAAVALKSGRRELRAATVRGILAHTDEARHRGPLIRVLGKIGDDGSLPLLRNFLESGDAGLVDSAMRALADWPTATARDDLFVLARTASSLAHRVLALRAFVRLTGFESFRRPQAVVESLAQVLPLAGRAEERLLILGVLPDFPCSEALRLAESLKADVGIGSEARAAAERIRERLSKLRN